MITEPSNEAHLKILFEMESLLLAIRKDLGHSNRGTGRGAILGLFINDIDDYIK